MMVGVKFRAGVWQRLIDLLQSQKPWMHEIAAAFDLTPQMTKALHSLPLTGSITMKSLADDLWCDASNATGIVDRLEARGFVERRPSDRDRRVKCVLLTVAGKRLRRKIDDRLSRSPPAIAALSVADQEALVNILDRAIANAEQLRERKAE